MIRRSRISVRPNVRPNPNAAGRSGPQPASQDAPGPQPASQDAPGPQPVSQDAPGPQPVSQDVPGSQPSSQDAPGPQPVSQDAPGPQPVSQDVPGSQPSSQDAPGPQPVSQDAPGPQPASQDAPGPQPASQDAPGPQPSSQDAPASPSLETPQLSQEARSEINEDHSVAVVTERLMASPLRKSVPRDTGDAGGEGTSSSAALQRRKRFAVKPKVAPALNRARAPKSPVRTVVLDSPVVEVPGAYGEDVTASSQADATLSLGTTSPSQQQQTLSGGLTGGDERPTTPFVPAADDDPTERAQVPPEKSQPLEPSPNSQAKDVPPKPPDKPCLSDKEAMEISERAKTLVSKATKGGLIPPQAQLTLSRLLNDTSDLQRLEKARKLRELLKKEINKDKVKKNMKNTTAKTRIKEYTPDTAKMTMRDLIYYLPVSNPMSSYLADSQGKNENEIVVPPSPARQQSPERAPSPAPSSRHEDDDGDDEQEENNEADEDQMMVPRVKVAEDGSLIIDEESLTVEVKRAKGPNPADGSDPIFERGSTTTYSSFRKGNYTKPWTTEETEMFFLAISMVGTDFSMICQLFPHRARSQIKHKFKREERDNSWRIDKAFKEKRKMDIEFFSKLLEKILEVQKCKKPKSREKKTKSPSEEKTTRKRGKKTKGKKAEKKLSDVEEEEEEDGGADMEEVEGEKENEDVSNERGTPASPQRKRKRKKKDDGESTEEPSEEKKKKKKKKDEKQTDEQVEACLPEAGDAALPEDQSAMDSSGKTESVAAAKSAVIKPAQLSRGRAPKPLVPLGRKWGKKGQTPSTKDPDVGGKSPVDDKVDEESSPLRPTKEHKQDADSSCDEEHSTASPPKPTRYGRLPKPVQHLNYSAKEDALSSASDDATPGSASKPKRLVKKAVPSKAKSRPKKPQLVTLRASQSEGSDDDGDNDHGLSEPEEMDPQHHSSSPHKDSSAPVFVPVGLRSPQPVVSVVEETMEELDISVNVPDVLGMARDALCSDASCERAQDNTGTVPCDHQLDLLVDVIDLMSSDHVEVSSDESYNEAAQTLLTIGTVAHHSQLAQTPTSPQSHTAGAPFNSGNETSSHALEEELATETVTHIQSSGSPVAALPSSPVSTDPSQPTDSDVPDTSVIDCGFQIDDGINEKTGEGTHSSQKTNAEVEAAPVVDVSQEMPEQNSPPAKRRRLPKAKPKPNLARAARFAQTKSDQIEETATEAVTLTQSRAAPVAAVPSGPVSTESSQTTDVDQVSASTVSDIVPASLAENTPSTDTALSEEPSVSQTNSADVGPGLQKDLGTDILEQYSPQNRESGFSDVEHKPILGEANRKAVTNSDSHSTEQTLTSTENSCTAHAQDETITSDIAASDAQNETKTIAATELQVIKESPALESILVQDTSDHHTTNAEVEAAPVVDVSQEMPEQNSPAKKRRLPKAKPKPNLSRAARFAQSKSNQIEETATEAVTLIQSSAAPVAAVPSGPVSTESSQKTDTDEPSVTVPSELSKVSESTVSDIVPASLAEYTPSTDTALSEEPSVSQTNSADVGPGLQKDLGTDIWEQHSSQKKESGFSNVDHKPILGEATRKAVTKSDSHSTEQTENSCTAHAQDETITSDIVSTDAQDETRSIAATELQVIKESPVLDSILVQDTSDQHTTNADVEAAPVVDVSQEMPVQNSPAKRRRLPKAKPKPNLGRAARSSQSKSNQIEETATEAVALIQSSAAPVAAVPSGPVSTESSQTTDVGEPSVTVLSELSKVSVSTVSDMVPASLAEYTPSTETALSEETSVSQTNSADVGPGLQKQLGTDIWEQHSPQNKESGFSNVEHEPILGEANRKAVTKSDSHSTEQTLTSTENSCTAHAEDETITSDIAASDAQDETRSIAATELQVIKESPALDSILVQDTSDHHTTNADVEAAPVVKVSQEMPEKNSPPTKRQRLPKAKPKPNLGRAARFAQSKSNQIEETATEAVTLIQSSAAPVAAVPSGPVSTESSQTTDVGEPDKPMESSSVNVPSELSKVSASTVSDIVPASSAEYTPSTQTALSEETSVSQKNSGLQMELGTDIWEQHSPQNKESGFSNVEHEPILGEAITKSDSHFTEQTLTSTENSCTAHAQDETITSDIAASDAQDETRSIAATELQVIKESPVLDSFLVHDPSDHHTTVSSMGKVSAGFASLFAFLPPLAAEDDDNYLESGGSASCTISKPHSTEDTVTQLEPFDNTHQKSPWFTQIIEPNAFVSHSPAEICTSEEKKSDVEPTCQGDSSSDSGSKKTVPQQRRTRFPKVKPKVRVPTRTARSKIQLTEDTNKQSESSSSVSSEKQPVEHLTTPQSISNTVDHRPESPGAAKPEMLLEKSDSDLEMITESFWVVEEPFTVTGNTPETQKSDKVKSEESQIKDSTLYDGNATDMDSASHLQSMSEQTSPQRRDRFTKSVDNTRQKSPQLSKIIEPNAFELDSAVSHSPAEICTSEEKKTDVELEPTCKGDSSSDSGSKTVPQQRRTRFPKVKPKVQVPTRTTRSRIQLSEDTNKQSEKESMDSSLNVSSEKQPIEHLTSPQSSSKTVDHRPESPGAAKSEMLLEKSDSDLEMITESFWVVKEPFTVTGNTLETQKSDKVTSEEPQIKDCTPDDGNATDMDSASHLQSMAEQTSPQRRDRFTKPVDNTHQKSPLLSKIIEPNAFQLDSAVSHSPAEICTSEEKKTDVELEPTCQGDSSSDSGSKTVPQQRRTRFPKVKPNVRVPTRTTRSRIPLTEETNNQSEKESGDSPSNVSSEKQSIEHLTPPQSSSNTVDHRPESHGAAKSEMLLEKSDSDLEMITESFWVVEEPFTVTGNTPETQKSDQVTSEESQIKDSTPDDGNATEMDSASHLQSVAEQHSSQRRSRCTKVKPNLRQATRVTRSKPRLPVETLTCSELDRLVTGTEIQPTQDLDLHSDVQILEDSSKSITSQQSRSIPECSIKEPDTLPVMPSSPMESNSLTANVLTVDDVIMSETSWIIENPFEGTDYVPETGINDIPSSKHLPTEKPPTSQQKTVPSSKHLLTEEPSTSQLKIKREASPKRGGRATRAREGKVIEPQPTEDAATTEMAPTEEADTREENKVEELQPFPQKETVSKRTRRSHPTTKDKTSVKPRRGSRATRSKPQPIETICAGSEPQTVNKASLPTVGSKPTPTKQADGAIMLPSPPRSTQHSELQNPVSYVEDVTKSQNVTRPASSKLTGEIGGEIMTSPEYTIDSEIAWLIEDPFSVSNTEAIELSTKPAASSTSLVTETGSVSGFNLRPATEAKEQTPQARTDAVTTSELQSSAEDASTRSKLERGQTTSASSKRQQTQINPHPHPWTDSADVILVSDSDQDIRDPTVLQEGLSENRTSEPTTKESLQDLQNADDASTGTCEREETSSKAPHPRRARLPKPKPCLGNSSRRTRMQSVQHPTQQTPAASSSGEKVGVSHGAVKTLEDSEPRPDNRPPVEGATVEEHKHCGPSSDPISSPSRPVITAVCSLASLFQTAPVMSVQDSVASHSGRVQSYPAVTTHPEGLLEQVPPDIEEPFFILSLTEVPVASTEGDVLLPYLPDSPAQQIQSSGLPSSGEGGHGLTLCDVLVPVTGETGPDGNVTRGQDVDPRPTACASSVVQNSENAEGEPEPEPTCPPAQPQAMEPTAESQVEKQDAGDAGDRSAAAELPPDTTSSTLKRPGRKPKGFLSFLSNKSGASPSRPARALSQAPQLGASRTGRRRAAPTTTTASATTPRVDQKPSTSAAPLDATQRAGRDFKQSCHKPDSQPSTSQHPDPEPSTSKCPGPSTSQRAGAADRTANVSLHTQPSAPLQLMSTVDSSHPMLEEHHDFVEDIEEPTGVTQFFLNDIFTDMDEQ